MISKEANPGLSIESLPEGRKQAKMSMKDPTTLYEKHLKKPGK